MGISEVFIRWIGIQLPCLQMLLFDHCQQHLKPFNSCQCMRRVGRKHDTFSGFHRKLLTVYYHIRTSFQYLYQSIERGTMLAKSFSFVERE